MTRYLKTLLLLFIIVGTCRGFVTNNRLPLLSILTKDMVGKGVTTVQWIQPVSPTFATGGSSVALPRRFPGSKLFAGPNQNVDGSGRGKYFLALSFLLCIWIFSIPPDFRRAHLCTTDYCVEHRQTCYDCVTSKEWIGGIADYYKNGGGIQFDFTVDQSTKDLWSGNSRK